ncbi:MAG: M28 family peptidase [Thiotrichaceae bacterium]
MTEWFVVLFGASLLLWFVLTEPLLPSFDASEFDVADVTNLQQHVISLTNSPRMAEFDNLRPPARYIHKQLKKYGKAQYQPFKTAIGTVNNVVIDFGPDTKDVLIIGAHYDSLEGMPGADGNASGVAGLIELARLLSTHEGLPIRVQLVAYALSEGQYFGTRDMGSFRHAQQLKQQRKNVVMMMSLDSIGYFSDQSGSQNYPYEFMKYFYPSAGDFIRITGRVQDVMAVRKVKKSFKKVDQLAVRSLNAPEIIASVGTSDNTSYWDQGFPAVLISDTAADRNPAYHTPLDTAEHLDYERMAKVVQAVGQVVLDITGEIEQPSLVVAQKDAVKE